MSTSKALREAKARLAAIEAKATDLRAAIARAKATRDPLVAKAAAITKRLSRVQVIKYLAGSYYVSGLDRLYIEHSTALENPTPKRVRDALENGALKVAGGGYGQSYSLKGLLPRVRLVDKPTYRIYERKVKARQRAEAALRRAKDAESVAFRATYEAGPKIDREVFIKGLVESYIAWTRTAAAPNPDALGGELARLINPEYSVLAMAKQHLAYVRSGQPLDECPCSICARERQEATRQREAAEHMAGLPRLMLTCPTHGRKRMPWERVERTLTQEQFESLGLATYGLTWSYWQNRYPLPTAYCPGGDTLVIKAELEREAKAKAKAEAKAAAERAKALGAGVRVHKPKADPDVLHVGDQVIFTCPICGDDEVESEVYESESESEDGDENGIVELRVGCDRCQAESLASAVIARKAA